MPKKKPLTGKHAGENRLFVDTSAWIALFSSRDQNHPHADRIFRDAIRSEQHLLTTNLVFAETHRLLLHRAGIRAAASALMKIEASPLVRIEFPGPAHHESAKVWMMKLHEHRVSYADAVSFAVMELSGCPKALTYDHHFGLAGFPFISAFT